MRAGLGLGASASPVVGPNFGALSLAAYGIGGNGASTWAFDFTINATTGANQTVWRLDNNNWTNYFDLNFLNATGNILIRRATASVLVTAVIFAPSFGVKYGCACTIRGDGTARAKIDGQTAQEVSGGPTTGLVATRWGATSTGSTPANATYKFNAILRGDVSDADLDALAARAAAW